MPLKIGIATWDEGAKGIDDAYQLNKKVEVLWDKEATKLIAEKEKKLLSSFSEESTVVPFPLEIFPTEVREIINSVKACMNCPVDFPAFAGFAVASSAIGTSRYVEAIANSWIEYPALYGMIIGNPSSKKSPSVKIMSAPLIKIQREANETYEAKKKEWKIKHNEWKKLIKQKDYNELEPARPRLEHIFVVDVTKEVIAVLLKSSPRGLYTLADELAGWIKSFDQYRGGKGSDREFWNTIWNVNTELKVDRKTNEETISVTNPFNTVFGGIQPDNLDIVNKALLETKNDGFMARLLFSYPECEPFPTVNLNNPISTEHLEYWEVIVRRLRSLQHDEIQGPPHGKKITLSEEARKLLEDWINNDLNEEGRSIDFPASIQASWGKFPSYVVRFAGIIHCLHYVSNELPEDSSPTVLGKSILEKAILLCAYFREHLKRTVGFMETTTLDKNAKGLYQYMKSKGENNIKLRDIYRLRRFGITRKEDALLLLKHLEELGLGSMNSSSSNKATKFFYLNS